MNESLKIKLNKKLQTVELFSIALGSEIVEEALEEAISYGISWLIGKLVSVFLTFLLVQGTKVTVKRIIVLIKPFVKKYTYREGEDKMKVLKKIGSLIKNTWIFAWNNKITGTLVGVGAYAGYCIYCLGIFEMLWANILLGAAAAVVVAILAIYVGGEKLSTIIERLASVSLSKEEAAKAKEVAKQAEEEAKKIQEKYEELKAKKEAEDKARLEAEAKALVEQEKNI